MMSNEPKNEPHNCIYRIFFLYSVNMLGIVSLLLYLFVFTTMTDALSVAALI